MVPQRTGLQFGSVSGSLNAFVVWSGMVSSVTHWLASIGAVLCGMYLLANSHGSRLGAQQGSRTFKPLSALLPRPASPLSLLQRSRLG